MVNIENSIINTFLYFEAYSIEDKPFELDEKYFSTSLKKEIVKQINYSILNNKSTQLIADRLISEKNLENDEVLDICAVMPLHSFRRAKEYYEELQKAYKIRILKGLKC